MAYAQEILLLLCLYNKSGGYLYLRSATKKERDLSAANLSTCSKLKKNSGAGAVSNHVWSRLKPRGLKLYLVRLRHLGARQPIHPSLMPTSVMESIYFAVYFTYSTRV